jgi:pyruvate dehydrogenase E2 component (dihydrolipoamide acetyltransferase)
MPEEIVMPRLSDTMQEGTISRWVKQEGEEVKTGDVLMEVETDKATLELNSYHDGKLARILIGDGGTAPVGTVVGILTRPGESLPADAPAGSSNGAAAPPATPPEAAPQAAPAAPAAQEPQETRAAAAPPQPPQTAPDEGAPAQSAPAPGAPAQEAPAQTGAAPEAVKASPLARIMAEGAGVDLRRIAGRGSGPGGRIVRADVEALLQEAPQETPAPAAETPAGATAPAAPGVAPAPGAHQPGPAPAPAPEGQEFEDRPLSRMRAGIARNIGLSKPGIPHIYLTTDVEVDALLALRKQLNEAVGEDPRARISVNDLVLKGAALALRAYPDLNAWFVTEPAPPRVRVFRRINIGVAVSVEGGLLVPVLRDVDTTSLATLAREAKDAYERVKANKPRPDEYSGGTFTVSNLGQWGIDEFQAVINPPQAGILAVGAAAPKAVVRDGEVTVRTVMRVTISSDHRVVDGVYTAEFLQEFKRLIETPFSLVV